MAKQPLKTFNLSLMYVEKPGDDPVFRMRAF